ncbi:MAG TPA: response regulator [Gemmatimonadaceae bacterium]|nr:response regulator [Gemmatimonadaceae bacterium]
MTGHALVVDDNELLARTLSDILRLAGWEVTMATSGVAAADQVARQPFDVVLMDIRMPGLDGVAAFKEMRAMRPDVRVVLMTAYSAPDLVAEAEAAGVVQVLSKPVNPATLLELLSKDLTGRRPVLIVDHDAAFLRTLSDVLRTAGYRTVEATDLAHATRALEERTPVAVLLHLHLGGITPETAVSAVHDANPRSAIILYSGRPEAAREIEDLPEGWVRAYLPKPFEVTEVTRVLETLHGED